MPAPRDAKNTIDGEPDPYDFARAARILEAMDLLRSEAVKANIVEIVAMVDATFNLLVTTYNSILRHEMAGAGNDMVQ
jgi:hypothetical protein